MFSKFKLGLKDHDPVRLAKTPTLADVAPAVFAETPRDWHMGIPWDNDVLLNDWLGCCGPSAVVNWVKLTCGIHGIPCPADSSTVMDLYRAMGWDGREETDNGVVMADLMRYCTSGDVRAVPFDAFVRVPMLDRKHFATAHELGGPLLLSVKLTEACMETNRWDTKEAEDKRIRGNHAILAFSVSPGLYRAKSWGQIVNITPEFLEIRGNEAYLPLSQTLQPNLAIDWDRLMKLSKLI